ncbi:MAG: hypothetical protein IKQ54_03360 [Oscillospiraceae bacterium]|nr:hypothetical protein [Oscillospiraceae bacterium]
MLKYIRIILIALFCAALAGAAGVFYYNYTHEDTVAPVFQADSELIEVSVTDPQEALIQGLHASDNVDGDLTAKIRIKNISTLLNETDVNVTYIVFDAASNYSTYTRTARYLDYTSPKFELVKPMIFKLGETVSYTNAIIVRDQRDGNITGRLKLESSTVVNNTPGFYTAELSATNRMGDTIRLPLTIQITDNSASRPSIVLKSYLIYLKQGQHPNYRRYLTEVIDPLTGKDETPVPLYKVSVNEKNVDTDKPGVYEVYYYYTGISGEVATVILTVVVE